MRSIEFFRKRLNGRQTLVGGSVTMKDPTAADIIAQNMDFIWIDMEHGGLDIAAVERHIMAAKKNGKPALVRAPELSAGWIKQILDSGAHGVIIPQIYTAEEVRQTVAFSRYYPEGSRGFGPRVPYTYNAMGSVSDYLAWANRNIFVCVQIETRQAYEALEEILSVQGYDSVVIGPADLALNCGFHADITHEDVAGMIGKIIAKAHQYGKTVGFGMAPDVGFARRIMRMGVDWIQVGGDFDYVTQMSSAIYNSLKIRPEE